MQPRARARGDGVQCGQLLVLQTLHYLSTSSNVKRNPVAPALSVSLSGVQQSDGLAGGGVFVEAVASVSSDTHCGWLTGDPFDMTLRTLC